MPAALCLYTPVCFRRGPAWRKSWCRWDSKRPLRGYEGHSVVDQLLRRKERSHNEQWGQHPVQRDHTVMSAVSKRNCNGACVEVSRKPANPQCGKEGTRERERERGREESIAFGKQGVASETGGSRHLPGVASAASRIVQDGVNKEREWLP